MRERYPTYEFISDIGSGLNYKRKGLKTILEYSSRGELQEIVVAHKDRLCRFGFELLQLVFQLASNAKIVVLEQINSSPEEELVKDLLNITSMFTARIDERRKCKKESEQGGSSEIVEIKDISDS
jgi:predicted site-specific integrase-resolvase